MIESHDRQPLTIKELKVATGLSISTLRRRVKDGTIPVLQLGGRGKKMLFPPTVIDKLCTRIADQPDVITCNDEAVSCNAGPFLTRPPAACDSVEANDIDARVGGLERPETGPIPNWMRSPLLNKCKTNKHNSKNKPCQNNAKTN